VSVAHIAGKGKSGGGKPLLVAGCTGPEILKLIHAINNTCALERERFDIVGFADIDPDLIQHGHRGLPVWDERELSSESFADTGVVINVATSTGLRWKVVRNFMGVGFKDFPVMVHPGVDLFGVTLGEGTIVHEGVHLGMDVTIGRFSLLLIGVLVNHEATIGECAFLGPGSIVLGRARLGDRVYLGAGAVVFPAVTVGADAVVGAGSVVRHDVPDGATVAGVPARILALGEGRSRCDDGG